MSLSRLASTEWQQIMHFLPAPSLLRLARCSRFTLGCASEQFAWHYAAPLSRPSVKTGSTVPNNSLRVVCYNMLVASHPFENELNEIEPRYRNWDSESGIRKILLKRAVADCDLWVLCEVTLEMLQYVVPFTHKYLYAERPYDGWGHWGSAIVYNTLKLAAKGEPLSRLIHSGGEGNQMVLSAVLTEIQSGKEVCVTALHLKAGYEDQERRRLHEIQKAMHFTREWLLQSNTDPDKCLSVVAGDLNSDRLAYPSLLREWMIDSGYADVFSGYKDDRFWTYNYWHRSIFDYIFIRGAMQVSNCHIPVSEERSPNAQQGSDHVPIRCDLKLA
jgi:endonuclease/exonuclease/phosphatase family metal-dependent hydrolase